MFLVFVAATVLAGCNLVAPSDGDAGSSEDAGSGDGDASHETDGVPTESSGALTHVVSDLTILTERLCDLDGNGTQDNSIADLGEPARTLFAVFLTTLFRGELPSPQARMLMHFPMVDDLNHLDATHPILFAFDAVDSDQPQDPSDDFSGNEVFYAAAGALDSCGEPLYVFRDVTLRNGVLEASSGELLLPIGPSDSVLVRDGRAEGRIERERGELEACVVLGVQQAGPQMNERFIDATLLEGLLAGGAMVGIPGISGLTPDLDLDGDGLESFILDERGHIESCVDGDRTSIPGRDCWRDPRMADGFSINFRLATVGAHLAGPAPMWRYQADGTCDGFPRTPSLWGPCPRAACTRWSTRSCSPGCGGEGTQRCSFDCSSWSHCQPDGSESASFQSCNGLLAEGNASCSGVSMTIQGPAGGARLVDDLEMPAGPLDITAQVVADRAETNGEGWALVVYHAGEGAWALEGNLNGVSSARHGYALRWDFGHPRELPDHDCVELTYLDGEAWEMERNRLGLDCDALPLDEPMELWLVINPDTPETEANELFLVAEPLVEGEEREPMFCFGAGCPDLIQTGDILQIGVTGSTNDELVVMNLTVETRGVCP
jgi:hypothetical protein